MTPVARLSAAIDVLDRILAGTAAELALTNWGRASRFAGSGDRHAVRDLVYDALRCRRSFAAMGGGMTGRGLILGGVRAAGLDPETLFTGQGHAPAVLGEQDTPRPPTEAEALDLPDWLIPAMQASLGTDLPPVALQMRHRAPVFLRVNLRKTDLDGAIAALGRDGIVAKPHLLAPTALEVLEGARKIQLSAAYGDGLVELQDAASQAVVGALPLQSGMRVLDLCAGGGGKTLALAGALRDLRIWAHDANPGRMRDLPERAARAGATITLSDKPERDAPFDLVLADAPCSGSGSWRRDPQGKWGLTPDRLAEIMAIQASILDRMPGLVAPQGFLAYATCSLLKAENGDQIDTFLSRNPGWNCIGQKAWTPLSGGDGFFLSFLTREV